MVVPQRSSRARTLRASRRRVGCTGAVARSHGGLAALLGRWPDAEEQLRTALDTNRRLGGGPWLARTQLDLAATLLHRAKPDARREADQLVREAATTVARLGAAGLQPRVDRLRAMVR